jgi:uncharacterized hydrophobic protein (TIGR00271 family)
MTDGGAEQRADGLATSPSPTDRGNGGSWLNRATVLGLVLVVGASTALVLTNASARLITLILGIVMIAAGLSEVFFLLRNRGPRFWTRFLGNLAVVAAGLLLVVYPRDTLTFAAQVIGVLSIVVGVKHLVEVLRKQPAPEQLPPPRTEEDLEARSRSFVRDPRTWAVVRSLLLIVGGVVLLLLTEEVIAGALFLLAVGAIGVGIILIAYGLENRNTPEVAELETADVSRIIRLWFQDNDIGRERRHSIAETLYFEQPHRNAKLSSFFVMMLLSTVIATLGVLQDSTAVVIGAMLIAPLMTPILGVAAAIVGGWRVRLIYSALLVTTAAIGAVFVAWLVTAWVPGFTDLTTNSQIDSRISPTLVDLLIAIAAGAAGAFATVDTRVSSSITGVAIAVALVPPLSVVGVTLQQQRWDDALGATLLFLTNAVGIVLVAAVVFVLMGFVSLARLRTYWSEARASLATVVIGGLVIMVPLGLTGDDILKSSSEQGNAEEALATWLGDDTDLTVSQVTVSEPDVDVVLVGPTQHPPIEDLEVALSDALGYPVVVTVTQVPATEESYSKETGKTSVGSGAP